MSTLLALKLPTFLAILFAAAVWDARRNLIPNRVTSTALILGIGFGLLQGAPMAPLAGAGLGLLATFPLFALGAIGGGDGKLLMGIGAFLGPVGLVSAAIYAGLAGGLLALVEATRRGKILPLLRRVWNLFVFLMTFGRQGENSSKGNPESVTIPYGLALATGGVAAWFLPILEAGLP
jgi:prepilin peptidase CpaA